MVKSAAIQKKKRRHLEGHALRVVDLFAGCGGFSLGFEHAGFDILGSVECDPNAARSHALNFLGQAHPLFEAEHAQPSDITKLDPDEFAAHTGFRGKTENVVDVLVGGPPCQAFARIGRAKLRHVASHPDAHRRDDRANLFTQFVRFVQSLMPMAIVVENVPDMMNHGGVSIVAEVCRQLQELGYVCRYTLMNAVHYGVPQFRERVFIVAYHESLGVEPIFPKPTHQLALPTGYLGSRSVAMKPIVESGQACDWFVQTRSPSKNAPPAITTREALSDLPSITGHLTGEISLGARSLVERLQYPRRKSISNFANTMRNWKGAGSRDVTAHVIRFLPRDFETFRRMKPGDQYPDAYEVAVERYTEAKGNLGSKCAEGTVAADDLWESIVPPYDPGKFPNKWWKLEPSKPSKTLTAHIGKDTYSHIHFDSRQARTISVREAARLQSFPDGFQFSGAMNSAFQQIGNAVPPLMAFAIAKQIKRQLRAASKR